MLPELKYFPVNWVDGMKISEAHFDHLQNFVADNLRDTAASRITNFNYGLLPPAPGERTSLDLSVSTDQAKLIRVKVLSCRAITPGGARIEILRDEENKNFILSQLEDKFELDDSGEKSLDIVVFVNPFNRVPVGQPDPQESPLRHPFSMPDFKIEILPTSQINHLKPGAFQITVARLDVNAGVIQLNEQYIPPSTSLLSSKQLMDEFLKLGTILGETGSHATSIVQKVKSEKQKTDLAINISYLAEKIIFFLADKIAHYRWVVSQQPPIYMIETFVSFAYYFKSATDCQTEKDREQMFTYFQQWTELTPAQFNNTLNALIEIEYNHQNIAAAIHEINNFMNLILKLFKQMSKLKYIGDQPDSGVVIGETIEPKKIDKKPGWSFLTD